MRETSGIIINNDIFINSEHVVKMEKSKKVGNDGKEYYVLTIHLSESEMSNTVPVSYTFDNESECDVAFNKIIMEMYGFNYAVVDFKTKETK